MTARGSRGSSLAVSVLVTLLAVAGAIVLVVRLPGRAGEMADKAAAQPLAVSAPPAPVSPSARPSRRITVPPGQAPPRGGTHQGRHHHARVRVPRPVRPGAHQRATGRPRPPPPGRCWP